MNDISSEGQSQGLNEPLLDNRTSADDSFPKNEISLKKIEPADLPSPKLEVNVDNKQNTGMPATKDEDLPPVSFFKIFKYATTLDYFLMIVGSLASCCLGFTFPLYAIVFGGMTTDYSKPEDIMVQARKYSLYYLAIGLGAMVLSIIGISFWMITGDRQSIRIRQEYFKALLRQEIRWYDSINPAELSTKVTNDCTAIQAAIGNKIANLFNFLSLFVGGIIVGFIKGWLLALILLAVMIPASIAAGLFGWAVQKSVKATNEAYEKGGGLVEQALTAIRTVFGLGGEEKELRGYRAAVAEVAKIAKKYALIIGLTLGFMLFVMLGNYSLGFWIGSRLVKNPENGYDSGTVLTIFFSIITATFSTGNATPVVKALSEGKQALARIMNIIESKPLIDIEDSNGEKLQTLKGEIVFKDAHFSYPNRSSVPVLNGLNMTIKAGQKTAFVGESGCGKTTCMQLIERFYDLTSGEILIDDTPIKKLNLLWLRNNIGYVGQEPVLFATSIRENLLFVNKNATEAEMIEACKKAQIYDLILNMQNGFDTFVGPGGAQLSGGQKQRIAIARAILRNPPILLLDEATSALDRKNEIEIQKTLDQISVGRTTIVIAHRLTTIQNADQILVFRQGKIVEMGTHNELMKTGEYYKELQQHQIPTGSHHQQASGMVDMEIDSEKQQIEEVESDKKTETESPTTQLVAAKPVELDEAAKIKAAAAAISMRETYGLFKRLFTYNKGEYHLLFFGVITAIINGMVFPSFSTVFSEMISDMSFPDSPDYDKKTGWLAILFLIIAISAGVANGFQAIFFSTLAENLTLKLRTAVYKKMLQMDMKWFDDPLNTPGNLSAKLAQDAANVKEMTSSVVGVIIQAISSLVIGVAIAFIYSWEVTATCIVLMPLLTISGMVDQELQTGISTTTDTTYKESSGFVTEAVNNIRTVASFGSEARLQEMHTAKLEKAREFAFKKGSKSGVMFGIGQFLIYAVYAAVFYVGAYFMYKGRINFLDMYTAVFALMFAAFGSGGALQYMPDVGKAKVGAKSIFALLDTEPELVSGTVKDIEFNGEIEFKNVWFKYPSRDEYIVKDLSFKIPAKKKVAFVGPSGCGKSTVFALLLRFYDIESGEILIDGRNIKDFDIKFLRKHIGIVSQEPTLFNGSIDYNIRYFQSLLGFFELTLYF